MLHKPSEERILGVGDLANHLLESFRKVAKDAVEMDCPMVDMVVTYIDEDDEFVPGTFVPELHLIVRRVDE